MFSSIKNKLIMSYLLVVIISIAVIGAIFQWRMQEVLNDSILNETLSQASVVGQAIAPLSGDISGFVRQSENIAARYADDRDKNLAVYTTEGFLIADSREPKIGILDPGKDKWDELFPSGALSYGQKVTWIQDLGKNHIILHTAYPLEVAYDIPWVINPEKKSIGAVDVSIVLDKTLSGDAALEAAEEETGAIGGKIVQRYEDEEIGPENLASFFTRLIVSDPPSDSRYRIRIYNKEGIIVASSQIFLLEDMQRESGRDSVHWYEDSGAQRKLNVAVPVINRQKRKMGNLLLGVSLRYIDTTNQDIRRVLLYSIGIALLVTIMVSLMLSRTVIQPITRITKITSGIAEGDFSVKVRYKGHDEIRDLADTIDYMTDRISENIQEIVWEKDKMDALLSALPEGVVAMDKNGHVLFLNDAACNYLDTNRRRAIGAHIYKLWCEKEVENFISESIDKSQLFSKEIASAGKSFMVYLIPIGHGDKNTEAWMMVIRDITDIRRLEETRTQFFSSISHELRTPLTIIKGFVHTILDDENEKTRDRQTLHAMEVIERETDRLTRLVNDLLELSRLRSKKLSLDMEDIKINRLLRETIAHIEPTAERMGIKFEIFTGFEDMKIFADKDRMKQVFINLIDNAIKYTPSGGRIIIRSRLRNSDWLLDVEDTGMGIATEELPFLFERFFRTKDREKKKYIAGTGLGMAIVKEIIDAHRGKIQVYSKEGKGTKVVILLPTKGKNLEEEDTIEIQSEFSDETP